MTTATAAPRPRTRKATPVDGHPYPERLLTYIGMEGDILHAIVRSSSSPNNWYLPRGRVVGDLAATCQCPGFATHGHCWHATAMAAAIRRFIETYEVQMTMDTATLRQVAETLQPVRPHGKVTIPWLCAERHLEERARRRAA